MPIHPHNCSTCGTFDVVTLSVTQMIDSTCPKCKQPAEREFGVPTIRTNATFLAGLPQGVENFQDKWTQKDMLAPAKAAGVSVNGKFYNPTLARFPGDPRAYFSDKDEMIRYAKANGYGNEALGVKARPADKEPAPGPAVAGDLVYERLEQMIDSGQIDESEAPKKWNEVAEQMTPAWRKKHLKEKTIKRSKRKKKVA